MHKQHIMYTFIPPPNRTTSCTPSSPRHEYRSWVHVQPIYCRLQYYMFGVATFVGNSCCTKPWMSWGLHGLDDGFVPLTSSMVWMTGGAPWCWRLALAPGWASMMLQERDGWRRENQLLGLYLQRNSNYVLMFCVRRTIIVRRLIIRSWDGKIDDCDS